MTWGDVSLKTDSSGHEYLVFNERQTKTRTGANPRNVRKVTPKMWANLQNPSRDPVKIYKIYQSKRPSGYSLPNHPFYIATTAKNSPAQNETWFTRNAVRVNKLSLMMTKMVKNAGLSSEKKLSIHSTRKYLVQKLSDSNVPPTETMQISGHKSLQSITDYYQLNEQQHKHISSVLQPSNPNVPNTVRNNPLNPVSAVSNSLRSESSMNMQVQGGFNSIFASQIHGGQFEIHIHQDRPSPDQPARKRIRILDSDSESQ